MAIEDTKKVKSVTTVSQANHALEEGWTLLAVHERRDGSEYYSEWLFGWQKDEKEQRAPTSSSVPLKL